MLCSCSYGFLCNLETGCASHKKSSAAVSILGTCGSATVFYINLGWVWGYGLGYVLGKETLYGSYMVDDINLGYVLGYVWGCVLGQETLYGSYIPMYGKLYQSGLCFGLWFGL